MKAGGLVVLWRSWYAKITRRAHALLARGRAYLDHHAEKEKARWGAHMEYRRRYTNPDEAKRSREPPVTPKT